MIWNIYLDPGSSKIYKNQQKMDVVFVNQHCWNKINVDLQQFIADVWHFFIFYFSDSVLWNKEYVSGSLSQQTQI